MADEPTPTPIPELPEDLASLTPEQVVQLHADLETAYQAIRTEPRSAETRDRARSVREAQAKLADHVKDGIALDEEFAALDADDTAVLPTPPEAAPEPAPVAEAAPPADPLAPAADPVVTPAAADAPAGGELVGAGAPMQASLSVTNIVEHRENEGVPAVVHSEARKVPMTAGAGSSILQQGEEVGFEALGRMVTEESRMRSGGAQKVFLAAVNPFEALEGMSDQMLGRHHSAERNTEIIHLARDEYLARRNGDPVPQTAAICEPFDIIRTIPDCVEASEPFSNSLPSRPIGRLGFQFIPSMSINDFGVAATTDITDAISGSLGAGLQIWGEAEQATVDPDDSSTWKPCAFVDCPDVDTVTAEAITACFTFDNTTDMSSPERIQDALSKITARKARLKTERLLQIAEGFSHHFRMTGPYGALPGFIEGLIFTLAQGGYTERLEDGTPYNVYTPPGLLEMLVVDRANKGYLTSVEQQDVASYVKSEAAAAGWNISLIDLNDVSLDEDAPFNPLPAVSVGSAATPLPGLGGSAHPSRVHIISPESVLYGSTGEINVGIERSPELMRQNRAQWFEEEYVMLTKHGCHPWFYVDFTLCPNGSRAGLATPYTCTGVLT